MTDPFLLSFKGHGHSAAVRCCCLLGNGCIVTGSLDSSIIIWRPPASSNSGVTASSVGAAYTLECMLQHHSDFVMCVTTSTTFQDQFYSGGKDCLLARVSAANGSVIQRYTGHKAAICCIAENGSRVASGDWGGEARVWCTDTADIIHTLSQNHNYAVTLCWLNGFLVSASQNKNIIFWNDRGQVVTSVEGAHTDIVRSLAATTLESSNNFGVFSVSNDRYIKLWNSAARLQLEMPDAHEAFIFHICVSRLHPECLYTSGDDGTCRIWRIEKTPKFRIFPVAILRHPATVWQALELPNGDIATACEDGNLRIWTQSPERSLPLAERENTVKAVNEQEGPEIDPSTLATENEVKSRRGKAEGELVLCRRGDDAIVLSWVEQKWIFVGNACNPVKQKQPQQGFYEGDSHFEKGTYDFIFDVEVGEGGPFKKLPFRLGQNPLQCAERFVARESLHKSFLPQIVNFIVSNAPVGRSEAPQQTPQLRKHFPVLQPISFSKCNFDGLAKSLRDGQAELKATGNPAELSELEEKYLEAAISKFKSPNFLKEEFRDCECYVLVVKLAAWPASLQLAVIDAWRIFALHPQYSGAQKKNANGGWELAKLALNRIKEAVAEQQQDADGNVVLRSPGNVLCCLRFISNLLVLQTNRAVMLRHATQIVKALEADGPTLWRSVNRPVRHALYCLLLNIAVAGVSPSLAAAERNALCGLIVDCMRIERDLQLFHLLILTGGTFLDDSCQRSHVEAAVLHGMQQQLPPVNEAIVPSPTLGEAVEQLLAIIS